MYSSISTTQVCLASTLPILSSLAVALRFKARSSTKAGYGADDYIILAALVRTNAMPSVSLFGTSRLRQIIQIILYGFTAFFIYCFVAGAFGDSGRNINAHPDESKDFFRVLSLYFGSRANFNGGGLCFANCGNKNVWAAVLTLTTILAMIKISTLVLYQRIFCVEPKFRGACNILIGLTVGWFLAAFFVGADFKSLIVCFDGWHSLKRRGKCSRPSP